MKKLGSILPLFFLSAFFCLSLAGMPAQTHAQQTFVEIDDQDNVTITGIARDLEYDSFTLDTGDGNEMVVTTEDMGLDSDLRDFMDEEMQVYVRGDLEERAFSEPLLEAEEIRVLGETGEEAADIVVIEEDDDEAFIED